MKKKVKKISIREFNRNMYEYIDKLPIIVENTRTGKDIFIVDYVEGG